MYDETRKRDDWSPMYAYFNDFTTYALTSGSSFCKIDFNKSNGNDLSSSFQEGLNNRAKNRER